MDLLHAFHGCSVKRDFAQRINRFRDKSVANPKSDLWILDDILSEQKYLMEQQAIVHQDESLNLKRKISGSNNKVSIQDLPTEVLAYVLSFLSVKERIRSELVCKRWRIIGNELPWRSPTKFVFTRNASKSSLRISISHLTDEILLSILQRCGLCLKELLLTSMYSHSVVLTWKSIVTIGLQCPNLETIKLHIPINNVCLNNISRGCPKLKVLKIFNFGNVDYEEGVLAVARRCRALECLTLSDLRLANGWFVAINRNLKTLRLDKCTLKPVAVKNLLRRCDSLKEFELAVVLKMGVSEEMLFKVFDHFKRTLKIVKILCLGVVETLDWCRGLEVLHNLEELALHHCLSVDDRLMELLAEKCAKLRLLAVAGTNVTDEGVLALRSLPCLKVLDISNMEMTGAGLHGLAKCGILEKVYLKGMMNIEEENLCSLAKFCPKLHLVDVSGTWKITNRIVIAFCEAVKLGCLKRPVKLVTTETSVTKNVDTCEGLELVCA